MLADTMMPEAFEAQDRSPWTGTVTTLGFALSALLTTLYGLQRRPGPPASPPPTSAPLTNAESSGAAS
jgi:hypothetical protein